MSKSNILDTLDPELVEHMTRREVLRDGGAWMRKAALASVPLGLAALSRRAFAGHLPAVVAEVLNFALTLEYLEAEYYIQGVDSGIIPDRDLDIFITIRDHEIAHVEFLEDVLAGGAISKPVFDFTAGGAFDPFGDYETFKLLAQGFEDTGVRAYKGQAPALLPYDVYLTAALTIHSVEARHASRVRRLRGLEGWIPGNGDDSPAALAAVYAGEGQTTQLGVDTSVYFGAEAASEAFDEPLSKDDVLAIAGLFLA